jgi:hypothetical protein
VKRLLLRRRLPSATAAIGVLLVLFVLLAYLAFSTGGGGVESAGGHPQEVFRSLRLGTSREDVERRVGPGDDALEFFGTGPAVEPMDAECVYHHFSMWTEGDASFVQLCFRDDRLVRRQAY